VSAICVLHIFKSLGVDGRGLDTNDCGICICLWQRPFGETQLGWTSELFEFDYLHNFYPLIEL
jgi:hypothetical protein